MYSVQNKIKALFLVVFQLLLLQSSAQNSDSFSRDSIEIYRVKKIQQKLKFLQLRREDLVLSVNRYIEAFNYEERKLSYFDHLSELKNELRLQVLAMLDKGTSSEAVIAINKAKIDLLLDEINTIEKLFGEPHGRFTSEFNAFIDGDLVAISERIKMQIVALKKSAAKFPESDIPIELLLRHDELEGALQDVQREIEKRKHSISESKLKEIDKTISYEQINENEQYLNKFTPDKREELYADKLRLQVEMRLHISPGDASLANLSNAPAQKKYLLKNVSGRPPPSTSNTPVNDVLGEINTAIFAEQEALEVRDVLGIATARRNKIIYHEWLKVAFDHKVEINSPYQTLSVQDLKTLKLRNERFLVNLHKESIKTSSSQAAIEIKETELRIALIETIIQERPDAFPFASPYLDLSPVRGPPLAEFEAKLPYFEKYTEAKELRLLSDLPFHIEDQRVKQAYEENIKSLKRLEENALIICKGSQGEAALNELIQTKKSILQNRSTSLTIVDNTVAVNEDLQSIALKISALSDKIDGLTVTQKTINWQSITPNEESRAKETRSLNQSSVKTNTANYNKAFPKNETWTKSKQGLINDIRKAPGGIIIDGKIKSQIGKDISRADFDVFATDIKILNKGRWYTVELTKNWTVLRQAWAYVNDERVAAIDLRPISADEVIQLTNQIFASTPKLDKKTFTDKLHRTIPGLSIVNMHPAFQNTGIGKSLILADQLIFDLLPLTDGVGQVEGQFSRYRSMGLNIDKLREARLRDSFLESIVINDGPRSLFKSIISIDSVSMILKDTYTLISKLDFQVYSIPNKKSGAGYTRLENCINWFAANRHILLSNISYLADLYELSNAIAFFKMIKTMKIENNFNDLVYLTIDTTQTPDYLFNNKDKNVFEDAVLFLEGTIKK